MIGTQIPAWKWRVVTCMNREKFVDHTNAVLWCSRQTERIVYRTTASKSKLVFVGLDRLCEPTLLFWQAKQSMPDPIFRFDLAPKCDSREQSEISPRQVVGRDGA